MMEHILGYWLLSDADLALIIAAFVCLGTAIGSQIGRMWEQNKLNRVPPPPPPEEVVSEEVVYECPTCERVVSADRIACVCGTRFEPEDA